jgi:hypothetical protein
MNPRFRLTWPHVSLFTCLGAMGLEWVSITATTASKRFPPSFHSPSIASTVIGFHGDASVRRFSYASDSRSTRLSLNFTRVCGSLTTKESILSSRRAVRRVCCISFPSIKVAPVTCLPAVCKDGGEVFSTFTRTPRWLQ